MNRVVSVLFIMTSLAVNANNVDVSSVSTQNQDLANDFTFVEFDLNWDNSWRTATGPSNWDAVWVFVKFRECGASPQDPWLHGTLSGTLADHSFGNLEPVLSDGSTTGLDADLRGVMLRRSSPGLFSAEPATSITLEVPNMLPNAAYHVRVLGIEMVYIGQGGFGMGGLASNNGSSINIARSDPTPDTITSEAAAAFANATRPFHLYG